MGVTRAGRRIGPWPPRRRTGRCQTAARARRRHAGPGPSRRPVHLGALRLVGGGRPGARVLAVLVRPEPLAGGWERCRVEVGWGAGRRGSGCCGGHVCHFLVSGGGGYVFADRRNHGAEAHVVGHHNLGRGSSESLAWEWSRPPCPHGASRFAASLGPPRQRPLCQGVDTPTVRRRFATTVVLNRWHAEAEAKSDTTRGWGMGSWRRQVYRICRMVCGHKPLLRTAGKKVTERRPGSPQDGQEHRNTLCRSRQSTVGRPDAVGV